MTNSTKIPLQAILFDFDGTLVDTKNYYFTLVADFLGSNPEETISFADTVIKSRLTPRDSNIKWELLKVTYIIARKLGFGYFKSIRAIVYLGRNHGKSFYLAQPTKNTVEGLRKLHLKGIHLGIISFSSRKKIEQFIENYLPNSEYFREDNILTGKDFGKTKEKGIGTFLEKFNLTKSPHLCAIVGDLGGDIIAGDNMKLTTIGITAGYASREILEKASPSIVVSSVSEIADIVESTE